jgi:peptidoglycan DL-endopeptidase CwlO
MSVRAKLAAGLAGAAVAGSLTAGPAAAQRPAPPHRAAGAYPNGRIPASVLCPIGQEPHRLRCDAAADWRRLAAAYRVRFGRPLLVTDSYRSYEAQVRCRQVKGTLCAVPGTSNHGLGLAVDMAGPAHLCGTAEHRWLEQNGRRLGWLWPAWARPGGPKGAGGECWHWDHVGAPS